MDVTAESNSQFVAFRRFLYNLSRQLTKEEAGVIVYIHFYDQKEQLKEASTLDILCKLESSGVATSSHPDKLLELMKDLKRQDLVSAVKDFIKKRKVNKSSSLVKKQKVPTEDGSEESESEDDLILRATLEAALVQATVLLQQMEVLQKSISGSKVHRSKIKVVVTEAAQTSEALAERLRKAEVKVNLNRDGFQSSNGSVVESGEFKGYINTFHTDRYASTLSSSVPNNPGHFYQDIDSISAGNPESPHVTRCTNLSRVLENDKEQNEGEEEEEEEEEDDYEHMIPGAVSADEILSWQARKSIISNDYSFSRPHSKTTQDVNLSKHASMVVQSMRPEDYFTPRLAGKDSSSSMERHTPAHNKTTTGNDRVSPRKWTNLQTPNGGQASGGQASGVQAVNWKTFEGKVGQKWAKPHQRELISNKRMSMPINNGGSNTYTKPGTAPKKTTSTSPLQTTSVKYLAQDKIKPTSCPRQHGTDDNYTTLHPTEEFKGSDDPNYYKHLDMNSITRDAYTSVRRHDKQYLNNRT